MTEPSQSTFSQQIVNRAETRLLSELSVRNIPMRRVPDVHHIPDASMLPRLKTLDLIFRGGPHFGPIQKCWNGRHLEDLQLVLHVYVLSAVQWSCVTVKGAVGFRDAVFEVCGEETSSLRCLRFCLLLGCRALLGGLLDTSFCLLVAAFFSGLRLGVLRAVVS